MVAVAVALGACDDSGGRRKPPSDRPPVVRVRVDAAPPDARDELPTAAELGKLRGELSGGKAFEPAKAYLWVMPQGADLSFYQKSEGGPCEHQFAPDDDDLYLSFKFPAVHAHAGAGITDKTKDVLATWKKPTYDAVDETFTLLLDDYDLAAGRVTGRVQLTGADGTRVAGGFEAALCVSPQRTLPAGEVHGRSWEDEPGRAAQLPREPLAARHLGDPITPAVIELVDASISMSMQHELHVYRDAPAKPCELNFGVGFNLALGNEPLDTPFRISQVLTLSHPPGKPFGIVTWREPVGAQGMEGAGEITLILDEVGDAEVRGRVVARFHDPAKSMLAGAFTARRCR